MVVTTGELRLARPLRRDAGAELERLYRKHSGDVLRYALRVLRSRSDAEDATQAVFIRALRALERGERVRAPHNWLIKIAHNECRRLLSTRRLHAELPDQLPAEPEEAGRAAELKRALEALPESQRQALVLRELEGRTYVEIAAMLNVSLSAVETLIFRARRAVREQLEPAMSCEEFAALLDDSAARPRIRAHARACAACAHLERQARGRKSALRRIASALGLPWWGAKVAAVAVTTATVAGGVAASGPPAHRQAPPRAPAVIPRAVAPVVPHPVRVVSTPSARRVVATLSPTKRKKVQAAVRAARPVPARPPVVATRRHSSAPPAAPAPRPAVAAPAPAPPPAAAPARPQPAPPAAAPAEPARPAPPAEPARPAPPAEPAPAEPAPAGPAPAPALPAVPAAPVALPPVPPPPPISLPPLPSPPAVPAPPAVPVSPANPPVSAPALPPVAVPVVPVPAPPPLPPVSVPVALPSVSAP